MTRVIVVSHVYSHPSDVGNKRYITYYCNGLKNAGAEIYYLYIGRYNKEEDDATRKVWGDKFFAIYQSKAEFFFSRCRRAVSEKIFKIASLDYLTIMRLAQKYKKIERQISPDTVIVNYYWLSKILLYSHAKTKAIATHDCFTNKYERIHESYVSMTPNIEQKYLRRSNLILSIQENESAFFGFLAPSTLRLTIYPPVVYTNQEITGNSNLLYIASNNKLNRDGLVWFIENIYKKLLIDYPELNLRIGGKIALGMSEYKNCKGIELVGLVDNIDEFYSTGDIVINPTLNGTGLKIKTIEGISYGKVVITSLHSSEGLYDNKDIPTLVGSNLEDFRNIFDRVLDKKENMRVIMKEKCEKYISDMNEYTNQSLKQIINI